ncbi:MAG: hypothetical protein QM479_08815 [Pseudomonadota bacterium]
MKKLFIACLLVFISACTEDMNKQGYQMMAEAVYKLLQKSGALL